MFYVVLDTLLRDLCINYVYLSANNIIVQYVVVCKKMAFPFLLQYVLVTLAKIETSLILYAEILKGYLFIRMFCSVHWGKLKYSYAGRGRHGLVT